MKFTPATYLIDDLPLIVRHPQTGAIIAPGEIINLDSITRPEVKAAFLRLIAVGDLIPADTGAKAKKGTK